MLRTEERNESSRHLSELSTLEMSRLVIRANYEAVAAVEAASEEIARVPYSLAINFI